jgi:hypothetical protein
VRRRRRSRTGEIRPRRRAGSPDEQAAIAPTVARFGPYFQREYWDRTFLAGLELLLDGFERQLAEAAPVPSEEELS